MERAGVLAGEGDVGALRWVDHGCTLSMYVMTETYPAAATKIPPIRSSGQKDMITGTVLYTHGKLIVLASDKTNAQLSAR